MKRQRFLAPLVLAQIALAACSYPARLPPPEAGPGPAGQRPPATASARPDTPSSSLVGSVVELALESIGSPYLWGGTDSNGFDCSGLIQFAYGEYGIRLPRVSSAQIQAGAPVGLARDQLQPGDVVGFSREAGGSVSHVGLYVGEDRFIHSSSTGVRISNLADSYWQARLVAARRIVQ